VAQLAYLRTVQDWIVRPQLRTVPGVADVDSLGGYVKEYLVEPDPAKIAAFGISYDDLADALEKANVSVGANYIQRSGEAYLVRADARVHSLDEIARAVVATRGGVPITVGQVAKVEIGGELRRGAASRDGHETVVGSALMLVGANSRTVAGAVGVKLQEIAKTLPPGIRIVPTLDRSQLVLATITTVAKNLAEGAHWSRSSSLCCWATGAALIATLVIPLSLLISAIGMNGLNISGNLMSLGALDFGLIIDGAVIIVENSLRRLGERQAHEGRLLPCRAAGGSHCILEGNGAPHGLWPDRDLPGLPALPDVSGGGGQDVLAHGHHADAGAGLGFCVVADLCARPDRGAVQRLGRGQGSARDCRDQASL
jgi:cobalt-zinc-cadmium resistance protein CzcA